MSSAVHSPGALATLKARGFVQQTTDEAALAAALDAGPVTFYAGFDPTADSLHVGHLLPVMAMAWLQRFGHRPIVVLGGGTAMVGDPTGKDKTREILTPERIRHNLEATGCWRCTTSTSCATSASTSASTGCSPPRAPASASSATRG
jgi:tyrosyl-tRNA synthetase